MTSLLAGTVAHGAHGGRGVSTSHSRSCIPGSLRNSQQYLKAMLIRIGERSKDRTQTTLPVSRRGKGVNGK